MRKISSGMCAICRRCELCSVRLRQVAEEIERDLDLVGITAIEDKLQAGVPKAISTLIAAGMKARANADPASVPFTPCAKGKYNALCEGQVHFRTKHHLFEAVRHLQPRYMQTILA